MYIAFYNKRGIKHMTSVDRKYYTKLMFSNANEDFIKKYIVKGSMLHISSLELKSEEAREFWGEEIKKIRNIKNVRK